MNRPYADGVEAVQATAITAACFSRIRREVGCVPAAAKGLDQAAVMRWPRIWTAAVSLVSAMVCAVMTLR